jgi:hypothetical protein
MAGGGISLMGKEFQFDNLRLYDVFRSFLGAVFYKIFNHRENYTGWIVTNSAPPHILMCQDRNPFTI